MTSTRAFKSRYNARLMIDNYKKQTRHRYIVIVNIMLICAADAKKASSASELSLIRKGKHEIFCRN